MAGDVVAVDVGYAHIGLVLALPPFTTCGPDAALTLSPYVIRAKDCALNSKQRKRNLRVADVDLETCRYLFREIKRRVLYIRDLSDVAIVAELPHGGALSARSARAMGMATAIFACIVEQLGLPVEYYTPNECTRAVLGRTSAKNKKELVAQDVLTRFNWDQQLLDNIPAGERNHVTDAAAVLVAAQHGNIMKSAAWHPSWFERPKEGTTNESAESVRGS